jgi:small subunit ribosomal protein S16
MGRRHRPFYRISAMDSRRPRDGRVLEELGYYDPLAKDEAKQVKINTERVKYWLNQGAQPSDTVGNLLRKNGVEVISNAD